MQGLVGALLASILISLCGCLSVNAQPGPGMVVSFASLKRGVSIAIKNSKMNDGQTFLTGGAFGPNKRWRDEGKTMGAAPDGRQLPEWVDFEWIEPVYPEDPKQTLEEYRALPRHRSRVMIRERVPQDVVEEILQSRRGAPRGKLPEKMLWVYLVWMDDGIRFRWQVERTSQAPGEVRVLRAGGDPLP